MKNKILLLVTFAIAGPGYAQLSNSTTPIKSYYYDYKLANPSFTGSLSPHVITTVYSGTPGAPYGSPELFYGSYEQRLGSSHNYIGGMFIADELGPFSQLHFGALYSRNIKFNERSGLRAGTQVYYQRRTLDHSQLVPVVSGDPLVGGNGISRVNRLSFDFGAAYYSRYATIAISLKNILHHEETIFGSLIVFREFNVSETLKATPSIVYTFDAGHDYWAMNCTFEIANWILFGGGYRFYDPGDLTFNAGVNIKDWVHVLVHLYSSYERERTTFNTSQFAEVMVRVTVPEK